MLGNLAETIVDLHETVSLLRAEVVDLHRRIANMHRPGTVTEVFPERGTFKMAYAQDEDGKDVLSPEIPWTQRAGGKGGQNDWDPPAVGEQMMMHSPSGDITEASWGSPGGWSNSNPQNHNKLGEHKYNVGADTSVHMTGDAVTYKTKTFNVEAEQITLNGKTITFKGTEEITTDAPKLTLRGALKAFGDWIQLGIHRDSRGLHR
jgi:phage baseplate assembly protein gpV